LLTIHLAYLDSINTYNKNRKKRDTSGGGGETPLICEKGIAEKIGLIL